MKVTCIHNATSQRVILIPETPLETLQLTEMAEASQKGVKTSLDGNGGGSQFTLEVG